jgi:hypothetical protein
MPSHGLCHHCSTPCRSHNTRTRTCTDRLQEASSKPRKYKAMIKTNPNKLRHMKLREHREVLGFFLSDGAPPPDSVSLASSASAEGLLDSDCKTQRQHARSSPHSVRPSPLGGRRGAAPPLRPSRTRHSRSSRSRPSPPSPPPTRRTSSSRAQPLMPHVLKLLMMV